MKKDKKILIKFVAIVISALLAGVILGFCSARFDGDIATVLGNILDGLVVVSPVLMLLTPVFAVPAFISYRRGQRAADKALTSDREELYEEAENLLENTLVWSMYMTIYSFAVFGAMTSGFSGLFIYENMALVLAAIAVFILCLFAVTFLQSAAVKQVKRLNPEKKGDVLDTKFQKDWFESCDEAERALIGAAAYKSYQVTGKAIIAVWLMLTFVGFMLPTGPLPSVSVAAIWFVQYYSYIKAARKNGKRK